MQTILASPSKKCPSLQLNVIRAPTAYRRGPGPVVVETLDAASIRPLIGTIGCGHCIA